MSKKLNSFETVKSKSADSIFNYFRMNYFFAFFLSSNEYFIRVNHILFYPKNGQGNINLFVSGAACNVLCYKLKVNKEHAWFIF